MKIKRFNIPTFEEWRKYNREIRKELGAYCVEIRAVAWHAEYTMYQFAVALSNSNACNIYTKRFFSKIFRDSGDENKLKEWYEDTVQTFHNFWEEHIKNTYLENGSN